jgi:hypothetical protein
MRQGLGRYSACLGSAVVYSAKIAQLSVKTHSCRRGEASFNPSRLGRGQSDPFHTSTA